MLAMPERFWAKVMVGSEAECWLWTASKDRKGYGWFGLNGRNHKAHRVAYELAVGPIPPGLTIDHLCRTHSCVNPLHMEPVTVGENTLRGIGFAAQNARKTHCLGGHPYSGANVYWRPDGSRQCRTCKNAINRVYLRQWRKRAKA